jgi:hypothetical protein
MKLARIESSDENLALVAAIAKLMDVDLSSYPEDDEGPQIYVGGSDGEDEGHWKWLPNSDEVVFWEHAENGDEPWEGQAVNGRYVNWSLEKPNGGSNVDQDCLAVMLQDNEDGDSGQWNDLDCDEDHEFVCELR